MNIFYLQSTMIKGIISCMGSLTMKRMRVAMRLGGNNQRVGSEVYTSAGTKVAIRAIKGLQNRARILFPHCVLYFPGADVTR